MRICNAQRRLTGYKEGILPFFFALQMLILTTAELQIRQDGAALFTVGSLVIPFGLIFIIACSQ
jgi:hypothetical protein